MGLFDFLKSEKKKQAAAEKAAGISSADYASKYTDAVTATREAAERMAATAPPKAPAVPARPAAAVHPPHTPTPLSAAHKAVPAAPAAPSPKPPAAARKRTYTVRAGDSLSSIARRELGNEARWRELYAMNQGVIGSNPELINPGQVLTLPH